MSSAFEKYLSENKEVGYVSEIRQDLLYVSGLPGVSVGELIVCESGELGQVFSLGKDHVEILILSYPHGQDGSLLKVGTRIARSKEQFSASVDDSVLGKHVSPLSLYHGGGEKSMLVDTTPSGIAERAHVSEPFITGVSVVDLLVPLGRGQRQLVIGDRKTGKTLFLQQTALTQAMAGTVVIYGAIAKRKFDNKSIWDFFVKSGVSQNVCLISSSSDDTSGLIFLTPYVAMTVAEYFCKQGKNVLVIFDDLTAHAKFYREITLLSRRFPGRSAYPGDIFYIHSRLLERAGKFKVGSITAMPVAESVFGDLSGYIQTNIMAMTDGHIFFDQELSNQGRRPPVNPFLSVTRVGLQAQSLLVRDFVRSLSAFLVEFETLKQFMHFGAELSVAVRHKLELGEKMYVIFDQSFEEIVAQEVGVFLAACLWRGQWKGVKNDVFKSYMRKTNKLYLTDETFRTEIRSFVYKSNKFQDLISLMTQKQEAFSKIIHKIEEK